MQIPEISWLPESKVTQYGKVSVNMDLFGPAKDATGGTWDQGYTYLFPYGEMRVPRDGRLVAVQFKSAAVGAAHKLQFFLLYAHAGVYDVMWTSDEYTVPISGAGWRKYLVDVPVTAGWYLAAWFDAKISFATTESGYYLYRHFGKVSGLNNSFPESYANHSMNLRGAVSY